MIAGEGSPAPYRWDCGADRTSGAVIEILSCGNFYRQSLLPKLDQVSLVLIKRTAYAESDLA